MQTWDYVTLVVTPDEHSISWEPQLEDLCRREGDCRGGAQDGAAPGRIFCREIFWVSLSMTFTLSRPKG